MNLFDKLVTEAIASKPEFSPLKHVVEKELLHHDILRVLRDSNLIKDLTFIGGTCLRYCYGGVRLSEDLDFTGGIDFLRANLASMAKILTESIEDKYGFQVKVTEPIKDKQNVDTWKIKIETRPESSKLPAQRINIDICSIPSYERRPMMLINPYKVDMGTSGLIIQAQSIEEIYTDKLIAFALRPNRIKYRDLWDILWLHGKGSKPRFELIPQKLKDRNYTMENFLSLYNERVMLMQNICEMQLEFEHEMLRFLPKEAVTKILRQENIWSFVCYLLQDLGGQI